MKRRFIVIAFIMLAGISAFASWRARLGKSPTLVFENYQRSAVDGIRMAKLRLRNRSHQPMWIVYIPDYPFKPELVKPSQYSVVSRRLGFGTTIYVRGHGVFSMKIKQLLPGQAMELSWPVAVGEPPERAGVCYYFGNFRDESDFLSHCWIPGPNTTAPWPEKVKGFFANNGFHSQRVVRCPKPLSFEP